MPLPVTRRQRDPPPSLRHTSLMLIGVGLDARLGLPFAQLRTAAREARQLGFESLWTPAGGVPDSFHVCAAWTQDTALRTGISVVPAVRMWTPLGLAAQAATLAQLSSGRFVLGLGTGGYGPEFWASVGLAEPADRGDARVRHPGPRAAGRRDGHGRPEPPIGAGSPGWPRSASLGVTDLPPAPVYLAALGPQMLRLAGEIADGALLNWATPARIAVSRARVDEGIARACREPGSVPMTMYIRVCIDDDVAAARQALGAQVLGYAMGRPGVPQDAGYRGLFAQMGFDEELTELEERRDKGAALPELVAAAPDDMLQAVGYYGPAAAAPAAFARLSAGSGRGHRPGHHGPPRPGARARGHGRADAVPHPGGVDNARALRSTGRPRNRRGLGGWAGAHQLAEQSQLRPGVPHAARVDQLGHRLKRHPLQPGELVDLGGITDAFWLTADEDEMLRLDRPGPGLKRDQGLHHQGPVAGLLGQLPDRGLSLLLTLIHQPAGQLPAPPILDEPVTPQQQGPVRLVHQDDHHHGGKPDHVMPVPAAVRQPDVDLPQPDPRAGVDLPARRTSATGPAPRSSLRSRPRR